MPVVTIEAPPGLRQERKKKMIEKITATIDEAYEIGDTVIFLHEGFAGKRGNERHAAIGEPKLLDAVNKIPT